MKDKIVEEVKDFFDERSKRGIEKYGTTLSENNKDDFYRHLMEELMDATLYLHKIIDSDKSRIKFFIDNYPNDMQLGAAVRKFFT